MVTRQEVEGWIAGHEYWHREIGGVWMLNASAPWDEPEDYEPEAGEVCTVSIDDNGRVHWQWKSDAGYDEDLDFATMAEFDDFYQRMLSEGYANI